MYEHIGKVPFLRLLFPVITAIIACHLLPGVSSVAFPLAWAGLLLMLLSFLLKSGWCYPLRWLFGAGLFLYLFSFTATRYRHNERSTAATFPEQPTTCLGTVIAIPEEKPRSVAIHLQTSTPACKKVVLYLEPTARARLLTPGQELVFTARLRPFRNRGNPDDFDYAYHMAVKGFSGSAYLTATDWHATGRYSHALPLLAQRFRGKAFELYRSFQLEPDAYALMTAMTLGYKEYLPDNLKEAFRVSGTAHVLAVSGLHVGIIYLILHVLFSFIGTKQVAFTIRQWLLILFLWAYVFVAGMSASVVRAAIMLTLFCIGQWRHQQGFTYNTLAAAAFFILLFRPFYLFDIGFQMSFFAVCAILFFQPRIRLLYTPRNRLLNYLWNLFSVSTAAQLGVFPLVLYYFGTFPTYFFITNLLVLPLVAASIYTLIPLIVVAGGNVVSGGMMNGLFHFFQQLLHFPVRLLLRSIYFFETLPLAQITDCHISLFQLLLLLLFIYLFFHLLSSPSPKPLLIFLSTALLFLMSQLYRQVTAEPPSYVVFNEPNHSLIGFFADGKRNFPSLPYNGLLPHERCVILRLSDASFDRYFSPQPFPVDILILSHDRNFDMERLLRLLQPSVVVLDSSLPRPAAVRIARLCHRQKIVVHDVTQNGAYSIKFSYICRFNSSASDRSILPTRNRGRDVDGNDL